MTLFFSLGAILVGLFILVKGADLLVDGASSFAKKLRVSDLIIGLTIVAFGTSAPELVVNITSILDGNTQIAIGNIVGSNIANIFLILGVTAMIAKISVRSSTIWKEVPFSALAAFILIVLAADQYLSRTAVSSSISFADGVILLSFFAVFMAYIISQSVSSKDSVEKIEAKYSTSTSIFYIVSGLIFLVAGGTLVQKYAVLLAQAAGVSDTLIALTIVAIGTSLPEFATSVRAAMKGNADIAIGNIVGSNIFNIFFILGVSALIKELPLITGNMFDAGMALLASVVLFVFLHIGKDKSLFKYKGAAMIAIYIAYLIYIIMRG